ncbi:ADP-ribosylation factor family-domain-containing protein [Mycena polygramma]|nr:ADP-ribosylation factor family-domain-containing protein [Mycena polygramma]
MALLSSFKAAGSDLLLLPKTFGKTSILHRFQQRGRTTEGLPPETPTLGFNIETISHRGNNITIKDFSGNPRIRPGCWRPYYWNAYAFVFVLDAADPARFPEAKEELHGVHHGTEYSHPLLVLANKMDLPEAAELATISEALGFHKLSRQESQIDLKGISAMTGEGFDDVLDWLVANVSHRLIWQHESEKAKLIRSRGY